MVGIAVGYMSWSKDIVARTCTECLTTYLECLFAFKNKPGFIFPLVNVQRNTRRRIVGGFDQTISSTGLLANCEKR